MKTSTRGLKLIGGFEGLRLNAYRDAVGIPTIGFGHTRGVRLGTRISNAQALAYLRSDVASAEQAVSKAIGLPPYGRNHVNQNRFDAMVSLAFNIGNGAFASSTVAREAHHRHFDKSADAFLLWVKAGGHTLQGLVNRRRAERKLFLTPPGR